MLKVEPSEMLPAVTLKVTLFKAFPLVPEESKVISPWNLYIYLPAVYSVLINLPAEATIVGDVPSENIIPGVKVRSFVVEPAVPVAP